MTDWYLGLALFLLVNLGVGLVRVLWGPTSADRMVAAQLFGTTGVAALLLLGQGMQERAMVDLALVLAVLSAVTGVAFARLHGGGR
jgi:multicomponent Na+:H+ antiporter subunit F